VKALVVFFLALDFLRTRRQTLGALAALLVAGAAEGAIGLVQYLTGIGPASFAVSGQFSRAFGTFGRPNSYAGYLEMIFPLGLALCALALSRRGGVATDAARGRLRIVAAFGATALIGAALFASYSRGAWLGTVGAVAVAILLYGARARVAAVAGVALLALILLAGGANYLPPGFADRLLNAFGNVETPDVRTAFITAENFSTVERRSHWEAGLQMFADNRLLGVGLGNFNLRFPEYTVSPTFLVSQGHAHNYYIHIAAEAGIVGLLGYLLLLGTIALTGLRALWLVSRPGADPAARLIVIAALAVIAAVAIHNVFENLHVLSMGVQLSTVWALLAIVSQPSWSVRQAMTAEAATREER
jgi:O-antigen ligase